MNFSEAIRDFQIRYIESPEMEFDEPKKQLFEQTLNNALKGGTASLIDYNCAHPKCEFLTYLVDHKELLLHGSTNSKIKILAPVRLSTSEHAWANANALYACSDGVLPIFYAIVNRSMCEFAVLNSCIGKSDARGVTKKSYSFSISAAALNRQPWTDGTVYVLPRNNFTRIKRDDGSFLEEWVSKTPVRALARLSVSPKDFPFLTSIEPFNDAFLQARKLRPMRTPIGVPQRVLDAYVGQYEVAPDVMLVVIKENDQLFIQAPECPKVEIYPESEISYFFNVIDGQITFDKNERGEVTHLTFCLNGQQWLARRVSTSSSRLA